MCRRGTRWGDGLYRRGAGRLFVHPALRNEAIFPDGAFRSGRDQVDRSDRCCGGSDDHVAQRTSARRTLVMIVPHHSHRGRQYQHDQQDGYDDTPDSCWVRHCVGPHQKASTSLTKDPFSIASILYRRLTPLASRPSRGNGICGMTQNGNLFTINLGKAINGRKLRRSTQIESQRRPCNVCFECRRSRRRNWTRSKNQPESLPFAV